jgi:DNA repair protein RadC
MLARIIKAYNEAVFETDKEAAFDVVKAALANNAAAVILAHNHPSGIAEPSRADEMLTRSLKDALAMVDVKVLDHFIVAGNTPPLSFAERGLL